MTEANREDTDKPFTSYDVLTLLYDEVRVEHFKRAIFETVKPGDVVVDAGSGTGILGMICVQAGASRVYCLELNGEFIDVISENAQRNGMSDQIIPIAADATSCDLPERVDVIVSEVMSAGFFYEPQLQILNNLKRFLKPGGKLIPKGMENYVELIQAQNAMYDLRFDYDTRFRDLNDTSLTTKNKYLAVDFYNECPTYISTESQVRALLGGTANAVKISYGIEFSDGVYSNQPTEFLLNPQIIFLDESVELDKNDFYEVSLSYSASSDPRSSKIGIRKSIAGQKESLEVLDLNDPDKDLFGNQYLPSHVSALSEVLTGKFEKSENDFHTIKAPIRDEGTLRKRANQLSDILKNRMSKLSESMDLHEPRVNRLMRALTDIDEEELAELGLSATCTWLDDIAEALIKSAPRLMVETVGPYASHHVSSDGTIEYRIAHLPKSERIGMMLGSVMRELAQTAENVTMVALLDDYSKSDSSKPFIAEEQHQFVVAMSEMMQHFGVIRPEDVPGRDYILFRESEQVEKVDELIARLQSSGEGYVDIAFNGDVIFFPTNEFIEKIGKLSDNRIREFRRRGILIKREGVPTCQALDAASFLEAKDPTAITFLILDHQFVSEQDKKYALIRAVGVMSQDRHHDMFFNPDKLSEEEVVYAVCSLIERHIRRYMTTAEYIDPWDRQNFDEYMERNYGRKIVQEDREIIKFVVDELKSLNIPNGKFNLAADVGTGSNFYPMMLIAPYVSDQGAIDLIEFHELGRLYIGQVIKTFKESANAGPWAKFEDFIQGAGGETYQGAFEKGCAISHPVAGSIFSLPKGRYDMVTAFFSTESITTSRREFWEGIRSLSAALRPGGVLVTAHMIRSHEWHAGEGTHLPAVSLTLDDIKEAYRDAGVNFTARLIGESPEKIREGYYCMAAVVAQKSL